MKSDYIQRQMEECRQTWFKDHYPRLLSKTDATTVIEWSKPGTWTYGMRFILHARWLVVMGDIGEATYEWSETITPEFLRGLDFGYFRSKCRASESGKDFDHFDSEEGLKSLDDERDRIAFEDPRSATILAGLCVALKTCSCIEEWEHVVRTLYEDGIIREAEDAAHFASLAVFPHPQQIGHFVGVQMALAHPAMGGLS